MNNNTAKKENKMGTMSVNRLLLTMSVPIMISMLVQALYNIVDSMFVSRLSENALTAVSLAFPAQTLIIAVSTGTGVGMNALISRSLGEKNFATADSAAMNGVFLAFCSYIIFALMGIFLARPFFMMQTDVQEIIDYGTSYLSICLIFSFGLFAQIVFERLLQSTGKTFYTMITQSTGAVINMIFDPLLIFGLAGFPKMGMAGAAAATVLGQCVAAVLAIIFNLRRNHEIHLNFKKFRPSGRIIGEIYKVGVPSIIMGAIGSVMTFCFNRILIGFNTTATAVFGVYFKLQSFIFMPVFGLNNGMVPIVAYNFGARRPDRLMKAVRLGILYAISLMLVGLLVFQVFPGELLSIFNASPNMLEIGIPALRIVSMHFIMAGFCIVSLSLFQALSHGFLSLTVSLVRQIVVLLPTAFLLSLSGQLVLIWWAFPIAELASATLSAIFFRRIYVRDIKPLYSPASANN